MPNSREIRAKISNVKGTQKITRAMEMVAASKMRKARQKMENARPYAEYIRRILLHATKAHMEYTHPYTQTRSIKKVGMIVVSTDRGLCGGLNINLFKQVLKAIEQYQRDNVQVELCVIGQKAQTFFNRIDSINIISAADFSGDEATTKSQILGGLKVMTDQFDQKAIDALFLFGNTFINTIKQKPFQQQLLPVTQASLAVEETSPNKPYYWDYIYEPEAKVVLNKLFARYLESQVYHSVVENLACEQAARMLAMKNATDNAGEMIDSLNLQYNKARQAMITQELSEIVSGASAV